MIKRIVVLLKILSKMSNLFNIYWSWSNRFLFISSWHLIILITSRDSDATLFLYRCLRHFHTEHELLHHVNSLKKRSKFSDCTFWKFSYKRKFFFLTHLLYAKSTLNSDRKLYKKKWCDLMRTWSFNFHWNRDLMRTWSFSFHWNRI
jgi:hypothetical protein